MSPLLVVRFWIMVFLHYFVWGAWYATMGTYMTKSLNFPGEQVGLAYGSTAVGALVAPFIVGVIADRFVAAERLLGALHLIGAVLLYSLSTMIEFSSFYPVLLAYTVSYMAGHGLTSSVTLHHSRNPAKEFPIVMLMASVGWIAAGLMLSWYQLENSAGMFRLASLAALVMGVYSFTLPHTPPGKRDAAISLGSLLGLDALTLFKDRSFATFMVCSFLICIPLSFYFSWMSLFMAEMGVTNVAAKMTLGQVSDVVFLLLLPFLLPRLGVKGILLLGISAWAVRFGLFALYQQSPTMVWMLYVGILLHGMCYDYIFVMGRMYVDRHAGESIRSAAQGLHAIFTLGAGMFVGSWLSGVVAEQTKVNGDLQWQSIWLIPAGLALVMIFVFAALFTDRPQSASDESPHMA